MEETKEKAVNDGVNAETAKPEGKEKKLSKKEKELISKVEELERVGAEKDDKYLRLAAEYDNFRRRSKEGKDATYENAMSDTVSELLPIIDNLERASLYMADPAMKEGLDMIFKACEAAFAKLGVEAYGKPGDKFDPNLHNAVMHEENADFGEGEISDVFQKGYKKGNKIIRFAMVKTAN